MSMIATAVVATAAVGAYTASQSASAATDAANAQIQGQQNSIATQQQEFNTINSEYAPQRNLGYGADTLLAQLFGISNPTAVGAGKAYPGVNQTGFNGVDPTGGSGGGGGGGGGPNGSGGNMLGNFTRGADGSVRPGGGGQLQVGGGGSSDGAAGKGGATGPDYSSFYNSPGYQFSLQQGEQAINRNAAAGGGAYSTSTMANLDKFAAGTAGQQYQSYVSNLLSMAGLGAGATSGTASAGQTAASNISQGQTNIGNANASGILGSTAADNQAWKSAVGGLTGGSGNGYSGLLSMAGDYFSDRRLKTDIKRVGTLVSGLPLYSFRYIHDKANKFVGVMADEAEVLFPEAVHVDVSGFKMVNYSRIV